MKLLVDVTVVAVAGVDVEGGGGGTPSGMMKSSLGGGGTMTLTRL